MHDLKWLRDNPDAFDRGLARRGLAPASADVLALDQEWRGAQTKAEQLQAERKAISRQFSDKTNKEPFKLEQIREKVLEIRPAIEEHEKRAGELRDQIDQLLSTYPNLPADDVPDGADETANEIVRTVGTPPVFDFAPKDHVALGEGLGGMDFARAGKLSGARFVVLSGELARLHRALGQFMLDVHTNESGYTEINPPLLVRDETAFGTGQLPKFSDDLFKTTTGLWLIPTAEVPLTNLVAGEIVDEAKLPLRFTAWTPCFRSEAGAAGKDTRGMIRQHQFEKVELVSVVHPDLAANEHARMTDCAEMILKRLGLAYRVMLLCTGDMGFSARKTYDIEVWLPGQNAYREISSCSDCGEFQARRMNARFRPQGGKGVRFLATLNGSALAIGRTLVAVLENYQRADGSIAVPEVLRNYMGGAEAIGGVR